MKGVRARWQETRKEERTNDYRYRSNWLNKPAEQSQTPERDVCPEPGSSERWTINPIYNFSETVH